MLGTCQSRLIAGGLEPAQGSRSGSPTHKKKNGVGFLRRRFRLGSPPDPPPPLTVCVRLPAAPAQGPPGLHHRSQPPQPTNPRRRRRPTFPDSPGSPAAATLPQRLAAHSP